MGYKQCGFDSIGKAESGEADSILPRLRLIFLISDFYFGTLWLPSGLVLSIQRRLSVLIYREIERSSKTSRSVSDVKRGTQIWGGGLITTSVHSPRKINMYGQ